MDSENRIFIRFLNLESDGIQKIRANQLALNIAKKISIRGLKFTVFKPFMLSESFPGLKPISKPYVHLCKYLPTICGYIDIFDCYNQFPTFPLDLLDFGYDNWCRNGF